MGWLMRSRGVTVYARGQKKKLISMGIDTFDSIQAVVTYKNNAVITYHMAWILPEQFPSIVNQGFRLIGSEGIVEADTQDRGTESCFTSEPVMKTHNSGFIYQSEKQDGTKYYTGYGIKSIQHFAENIQYLNHGGKLQDIDGKYPSGEEAHEVTEIIEAVHESIETGQVVNIQNENTNQTRRIKIA
jgi:predicted dehydrogenase